MIYLLALLWGVIWALFHQYHPIGKYLLLKRTWVTVATGCLGNIALLKTRLNKESWFVLVGVFFFSAIPVVWRSTHSELSTLKRQINGIKNKIAE